MNLDKEQNPEKTEQPNLPKPEDQNSFDDGDGGDTGPNPPSPPPPPPKPGG